MQFRLPTAQVFVPDGSDVPAALARTTHLAVSAHQDDIEIMAYEGILACFQSDRSWFTGVVVTNGSGSPRDDLYKDYSDDDMRLIRVKEQRKAAVVGEYSAQILLDYPSGKIKSGADRDAVEDMRALLLATRPQVVYTHNLADKHDTHVGVTLKLVQALRELPADARPAKVLGCEVWRDLDWMSDDDKVPLDVSGHENLQAALLGVFDSQICGGKRYDLATMGRRKAHATYYASHGVDTTTGLNFAMDLTSLVTDESLEPLTLAQTYITRFAEEVNRRIRALS